MKKNEVQNNLHKENEKNNTSISYFNGIYTTIYEEFKENWSNIDIIGQVCSNYSLVNHLRLVQEIKQKGYVFKETFAALNPISILNESQSISRLNDKVFYDSLELVLKSIYVINDNIIQELKKGVKQSEKIDGTSSQMLLVILETLTRLTSLMHELLRIYQDLICKKVNKITLNEIKPIISKFWDEKESSQFIKRIGQIQIHIPSGKTKSKNKKTTGQKNNIKKHKFFARTKDDISKSAVDFFSIGHILMGQIIFSIVYGLLVYDFDFYTWVGSPANPKLWAFIVAVVCGILWEPIENIILFKLGLKFESKRDSWLNLIFDIFFVVIGASLSFVINVWQINLLLVIIEIILFVIISCIFA